LKTRKKTGVLSHFRTRLSFSMYFSIVLHTFLLFGVVLVMPAPGKAAGYFQPLQVVLVNSKSDSTPFHADALAQHNLDGGGNTEEDRQAKSPLPSISDDPRFSPEQEAKRVATLEAKTKRMLTVMKSDYSTVQEELKKQKNDNSGNGEALVQKALEMARLEAQINKNWDAYQKLPRRKFIGARTQEYRFAQYIEDWRIKVERIGNLNYPEQARRQHIFGKLQLSVSIRADGSVESIDVSRSSGKPLLDAAAMRIVKLAAPFSPLPPSITKDTDVLTITRTWSFTSSDRMESE
jgi:protein TonB